MMSTEILSFRDTMMISRQIQSLVGTSQQWRQCSVLYAVVKSFNFLVQMYFLFLVPHIVVIEVISLWAFSKKSVTFAASLVNQNLLCRRVNIVFNNSRDPFWMHSILFWDLFYWATTLILFMKLIRRKPFHQDFLRKQLAAVFQSIVNMIVPLASCLRSQCFITTDLSAKLFLLDTVNMSRTSLVYIL